LHKIRHPEFKYRPRKERKVEVISQPKCDKPNATITSASPPMSLPMDYVQTDEDHVVPGSGGPGEKNSLPLTLARAKKTEDNNVSSVSEGRFIQRIFSFFDRCPQSSVIKCLDSIRIMNSNGTLGIIPTTHEARLTTNASNANSQQVLEQFEASMNTNSSTTTDLPIQSSESSSSSTPSHFEINPYPTHTRRISD